MSCVDPIDLLRRSPRCATTVFDQWVQVTAVGVTLLACGSGARHGSGWLAPAGSTITVAHTCAADVLVALPGGWVAHLVVTAPGTLVERSRHHLSHEIACLHVSPGPLPTDPVVAVGLWTECSVNLLRLTDWSTVWVETSASSTVETSLPRSLCVSPLTGASATGFAAAGGGVTPASVPSASAQHWFVVCGWGDGAVTTFRLDGRTRGIVERKRFQLGTQPVSLTPFMRRDSYGVFCSGDRPAVLNLVAHSVSSYGSSGGASGSVSAHGGMLQVAPVNLEQINYMAPFHSQAFPDCLALYSPDTLTIGTVDALQRLHTRVVPLGRHRSVCFLVCSFFFQT
jgi:DNA damage-binding protein 1